MLGCRHSGVGAQSQLRKEETETEQQIRGEEYRGREGASRGNGDAFELLASTQQEVFELVFQRRPRPPQVDKLGRRSAVRGCCGEESGALS